MRGRTAGGAAARRGASLIEILVVLVIILFGIFAIIRIFPLGLGTLRTTESRTLASQLANQQDELLKNNAAGMPQGVFLGYYDSNDNLVLDGTQDPDDLRPYTPGAGFTNNAAINPYFSDVNRIRYVEGEAVKVPAAVSTTAATSAYSGTLSGSVYLLNFGPIFLPAAYGPSSSATQAQIDRYIRVYGAPLQSIGAPYAAPGKNGAFDNSGDVQGYLSGPQSYLIDDGDPAGGVPAHILFPASAYGKTFFLTYSYVDSGGAVQTVQNVQIVAGQDDMAGKNVGAEAWQQIPVPATGGGNPTAAPDVVAGSDRCSREFTRVPVSGSGVAWTSDPYEYALLDDNFPVNGGGTTFANLGRIAFNPHGANYGTRSAYGQEGFTAYVDYSVLDWHILRDDREVPNGIPGTNGELIVRTTLPNIKQAGVDVNRDNTLYDGMFGPKTQDLIVVNLADGSVLTPDVYTPGSAPNAGADYWVNQQQGGSFQSGVLYVNSNRVPAGAHLRILYKADGDWAVALQKAYSRYRLDDPTNSGYPPVNDPRGFAVATGSASGGGAEPAFLRFNNSEYNKSVVVRLQYTRTDGTVTQTAPLQVTLDDTPVTNGGNQFATKDVTGYMPGRQAGTAWGPVGGIANGVSVKSRVIYRDANSNAAGGAATGTGDPAAGWRIQDIDTYLTPAPSQP